MASEHEVELIYDVRILSYGVVDGERNVAEEVQGFLDRYLTVHFPTGASVQFKGMNFTDRSYLQEMEPAPVPQAHNSIPDTTAPSYQEEPDTSLPGNSASSD